jgi:two-component system, cell cycle sensor histidine kinase and response regulator CckA
LKRTVGNRVSIAFDLAPDLGLVEADPTKLEQVLLNLVINARDASPFGAQIDVRTRNRTAASVAPLIPSSNQDWVELQVQDHGEGIDPQSLPHIFEPFYTTKPFGQGTGLGLATVFSIVSQSNGFVFAESVPAKGTTFRVLLPQSIADGRADAHH